MCAGKLMLTSRSRKRPVAVNRRGSDSQNTFSFHVPEPLEGQLQTEWVNMGGIMREEQRACLPLFREAVKVPHDELNPEG